MDKWEYTWYTFNWEKGKIEYADGSKMKWSELWAHFSTIGSNGWEMVSMMPVTGANGLSHVSGDTSEIVFAFKRRIE